MNLKERKEKFLNKLRGEKLPYKRYLGSPLQRIVFKH